MGNIYNINPKKLKQISKVLTLVFVFAFTNSFGQPTNLFISEYIEGSSNNKFIEIYNGTGAPINLAGYVIRVYANGAASATSSFTLSGTLASCSVCVIENPGESLGVTSNLSSGSLSFNGDDAVTLETTAGVILDVVGNIGCDPGTGWTSGAFSTLDKTLVRNAAVCGGVGDNGTSCPFPTLATEWTQSNVDVISNLGSHSCSCANCTANTITTGSVSNPPFALTDCTITASGSVAFTSSGTFTGNTYTAQLSNSSGSFATPTNIGTLVSNANSGTINITIPASTASGTGYLIRVVSSSPAVTGSSSAAFTITLTCAAASGSCTVNGAMGTGYTFGCGNGASPCNLASVYSAFGTFCGGSAIACGAGCSAVNMSTTYNLEAGCTATITAEYKARPTISAACSNAAMDGGDQLFITSIGGSLVGQSANLTGCGAFSSNVSSTIGSGCGNGDGIVTMTITGGAVTIGGVMDRGDEIITYTLNASGTCSICPTLLPIGLIDFYGVRNDDKNDIYWKVDFQEDIQYYMIEKSGDGVNFDQFGIIPAHTYKSNDAKNYYMEDYSPYSYITYYRLSVRESNGAVKIYNTVYVNTKSMDHWGIYHYQKEENLVIDFKNSVPKNSTVSLFDLSGKLLAEEAVKDSQTKINVQNLAEGLYFVKVQSPYKTENFKIIIQK